MSSHITNQFLHPLGQARITDHVIANQLIAILNLLEAQLHQLAAGAHRNQKNTLILTPVKGIAFFDQILDQILNMLSVKAQLQITVLHFIIFVHGTPP
ncbi:hypothetical protein D3C86_1716760 [compost metagenome]